MDTFTPGPGKPKRPRKRLKGPNEYKPITPRQLFLEEQQKLNEEKKERERMERNRPKPSLPPLKKGGSIKKKLVKAKDGISTGPGFVDKVKLAAKRISRNMTNRRAVNLDNRSSKLYDTNKEKSDKLFAKAESLYDKATDKNNKIKAFKKTEGFKPGGDGTQTGGKKFRKPGAIWSKAKKGGVVKSKKK